MYGKRLKAIFGAVANSSGVCAIVINPSSPNHNGDKLKALLQSLRREYNDEFRFVRIVLDDVVGEDGDRKKVMERANAWMKEHRGLLNEYGFDPKTIERWSHLETDEYYQQKVRDMEEEYSTNPRMRAAVNQIALKRLDGGESENSDSPVNIGEVRTLLEQEAKLIFQQFAGLCLYRAQAVLCDWDFPQDTMYFEREKNKSLCPNSLDLPDFVSVTFQEQAVILRSEQERTAQATKLQESAQIIPLFPAGPK